MIMRHVPEPEHRIAAPRRFQRPDHNREQQYKRLARARAPEQEQIPDHAPDQFQRRLLVVRKFKACHKSKSFFNPAPAGRHRENMISGLNPDSFYSRFYKCFLYTISDFVN
jgi:hypothetical protein